MLRLGRQPASWYRIAILFIVSEEILGFFFPKDSRNLRAKDSRNLWAKIGGCFIMSSGRTYNFRYTKYEVSNFQMLSQKIWQNMEIECVDKLQKIKLDLANGMDIVGHLFWVSEANDTKFFESYEDYRAQQKSKSDPLTYEISFIPENYWAPIRPSEMNWFSEIVKKPDQKKDVMVQVSNLSDDSTKVWATECVCPSGRTEWIRSNDLSCSENNCINGMLKACEHMDPSAVKTISVLCFIPPKSMTGLHSIFEFLAQIDLVRIMYSFGCNSPWSSEVRFAQWKFHPKSGYVLTKSEYQTYWKLFLTGLS